MQKMGRLAGIAAMMAASGGFEMSHSRWGAHASPAPKAKPQTDAVSKRRAANKRASKQRKGK